MQIKPQWPGTISNRPDRLTAVVLYLIGALELQHAWGSPPTGRPPLWEDICPLFLVIHNAIPASPRSHRLAERRALSPEASRTGREPGQASPERSPCPRGMGHGVRNHQLSRVRYTSDYP